MSDIVKLLSIFVIFSEYFYGGTIYLICMVTFEQNKFIFHFSFVNIKDCN